MLCICKPRWVWGHGPPGSLIFRRSETTSSAFSGMMNSIWEKLHVYYAYSQNNIQHILTLLLHAGAGILLAGSTQSKSDSCLLISVRSAITIANYIPVHVACMLRPLSCVIDRVVSCMLVIRLEEGNRFASL